MKNILFNKLALIMVLVVFAFASAQVKLDVKLLGETFADKVGGVKKNESAADGNNSPGRATFFQNGSFVDELHIGFTATIDNVVAHLKLREAGGDAATGIKFDSAYLEVKDLFDGLLTIRFFDIGYGTGYVGTLRADTGSHGVKFTIKPIDLLSISVGYGIDQKNLGSIHFASTGPSITNNKSALLHLIQADIGINNAFVPTTISFGTIIIDNTGADGGLELPTAKSADTDPDKRKVEKIYHMSAGVTADVLAFLKAGALKLDVGAALPFASARVYDFTKEDDFKNDLNLMVALHGSVSDLGVEGLGLAYTVHYALDTYSKLNSFDEFGFKSAQDEGGFLYARLNPSYAIGQFKFDVDFRFTMVGKKEVHARNHGPILTTANTAAVAEGAFDSTKAFNILRVEPEITWTPATGNSVSLFFRYYDNNMNIKNNGKMRLGLRYQLNFGIEGI